MQHTTVGKKFRAWLTQPLGASLIAEETKKIDEFIQTIFGFHLMFLGEPPLLQELQESPILHRIWIHPEALKLEAENLKNCVPVISRQDKLPILLDEIDLIYLGHCLEFNVNPHEILRESYAALKPEGYLVISGFNPWSFWGLWRFCVRYIHRAAWDANFISVKRLKDWLSLLGFDIVQVKSCFFRPPLANPQWLEKFGWMEKLGHFLFPWWGASYIILARKRILTMTPLRVEWKRRRKMIPRLVEPVTFDKNL